MKDDSKQPIHAKHHPQRLDIEKPADEQCAHDDRYTVTNWNGFKVLNCRLCAYDTMYEQQFDEHYFQKHVAPRQPEQRPLLAELYDQNNKRITKREI